MTNCKIIPHCQNLLFGFAGLIFLISGCKKDANTIDNTISSNTISAKIDGVAWQKNSCSACIGGGNGIETDFTSKNVLFISGQQGKVFIDISIGPISTTGNYSLKATGVTTGYGDYLNSAETGPNGESPYYYQTNDSLTGSVTITRFDPANKIIEGTFTFDAANRYYPTLIKHITEGKFSVPYH